MAKQLPKKEEENTGEWLNTYADMVTLLLTFFVLLFACSNLDETKLQYVYQAFQMHGKYLNPIVAKPADSSADNQSGFTDDKTPGDKPQSFEELHQYLSEYIDDNELSELMSVEEGAATLTIRFNNSVLFDGNSYMLREDGKKVLRDIIPGIKAIQSFIQSATVTGHTSAGKGIMSDWNLSSLRACSVVNFMDDYNTLASGEYCAKGRGDKEPIARNDTLEGQQKNRRVEITFLKSDLDYTDKNVIMDILQHDFKLPNSVFNPDKPNNVDDYQNLPDGSADKIIGFIKDKYPDGTGTYVGTIGPGPVDGSQFIAAPESGNSGDNSGDAGSDKSQDTGSQSE